MQQTHIVAKQMQAQQTFPGAEHSSHVVEVTSSKAWILILQAITPCTIKGLAMRDYKLHDTYPLISKQFFFTELSH